MICVRCKKRPAIVFVQRMEAGQNKQEGYCLTCEKSFYTKFITSSYFRDTVEFPGDVCSATHPPKRSNVCNLHFVPVAIKTWP